MQYQIIPSQVLQQAKSVFARWRIDRLQAASIPCIHGRMYGSRTLV